MSELYENHAGVMLGEKPGTIDVFVDDPHGNQSVTLSTFMASEFIKQLYRAIYADLERQAKYADLERRAKAVKP